MADFERFMRTYIEFPDARKLCNRFAAIAEKSHREYSAQFARTVRPSHLPNRCTLRRGLLNPHKEPLNTAWKPQFPSLKNTLEHGPSINTQIAFKFQFSNKGTLKKFITGLNNYVFRRFGKSPKTEQLKVFIFEHQPIQKHRSLIITETPQVSLRWPANGVKGIAIYPREDRLFRLLSAILSHVRMQYSNFRERSWVDLMPTVNFSPKRLSIQAVDGRLYPSGRKARYLLGLPKTCSRCM